MIQFYKLKSKSKLLLANPKSELIFVALFLHIDQNPVHSSSTTFLLPSTF